MGNSPPFDKCFVSGIIPMEWEYTEVRVEYTELEHICNNDIEPMDWEDVSKIRFIEKIVVSAPINLKIPFQLKATLPAMNKVSAIILLNLFSTSQVQTTHPALKGASSSLHLNSNSSLLPVFKKVSLSTSPEFIRRKIRTKLKVSLPVSSSSSDMTILKARRTSKIQYFVCQQITTAILIL
ncbi:hypothetical protein NPIL_396881 [Nephila pilipes]|uniref:Uncharacterized protein n=1 Tax=Nephila pilipes TaxID=299642 RepID=A0A8X6QI50_NEPPI|nr:hypothetical protein NPIL_396881 [Nephila pilipes]